MHWKTYKSNLLFVHSRGSRCKLWGLLHCDDRRLRWWASRDGPQRDRSRSDTNMIKMNFNSYASLAILFIIPVLLCFVFDHETMYTTRVLACLIFLTVHKIEESLKNSDCPFRFLFQDFRLCSRYNNVNYGAWQVYKPLFGSTVAICGLACSEITLSVNEKNLERSPGNGQT